MELKTSEVSLYIIKNESIMSYMITHVLRNECPNCHKGKVLDEKNIFFTFKFPKMHKECSECGFKFEKEPGFFFGAMYMSYGLTVAQGIATYCIAQFFFEKNFDLRIIPIIAVVIIAFSFFNIRLSRLLWIYMFKNYSS
jgi:ribosomal protein S27AE